MNGFRIFLLRLKSSFKRILTGLLVTAALLAVMGFCGYYFYARSEDRPIHVALVSGDPAFADLAMGLADEIQGVSEICDFERMDEDSAFDSLLTGITDMIILVPDDFYEKASAMRDAKLIIYTRKEQSAPELRLLAMLGSAAGLMQITDAEILSMYDVISVYDLPLERGDMERELLMKTYSSFYDRNEQMKVETVSAYGAYDPVRYYITSAIVSLMILGAVTLFGNYSEEEMYLDRVFFRGRFGQLGSSICHIAAMTVSLWVSSASISLLLNLYLIKQHISFSAGFNFIICLFLTSLSISLWIHLIISLTGTASPHSRTVYILSVLLLLVASGVIVPAVYLPRPAELTAPYLPAGTLHRILLSGMWPTVRISGMIRTRLLLTLLITDALIFSASVPMYGRVRPYGIPADIEETASREVGGAER